MTFFSHRTKEQWAAIIGTQKWFPLDGRKLAIFMCPASFWLNVDHYAGVQRSLRLASDKFCETQFNWARTWRLWGWVAFSGAQTPSTSPHSSGTTRKSRVWESPPLIWRAPKRTETEKSRPPSLPPAARQPGVMPANPKGTQILHQPLPGRKWRV